MDCNYKIFVLTHINTDNTYSIREDNVKITITQSRYNSTIQREVVSSPVKHLTKEQIEKSNVFCLGIFRNPMTNEIVDAHPIQSDDISSDLLDIIKEIKTPNLVAFADCCRRIIPEYIFKTPASTTGKYHPASNLGYQGLLRHTVFVCKNLLYMTEIDSTRQLLQLSQLEIDLMLIACMMHDFLKEGWDNKITDYQYHAKNAANAIRCMSLALPYEQLEFIARCIDSHMGQWSEPKPSDKYQWLVHLSDFMASRQDIGLTYKGNVYYKNLEGAKQTPVAIEVKVKEKVTDEDKKAIESALKKLTMGYKVSADALNKFGIERTQEEVIGVLNNILKYNMCSEKQKKYMDFAKTIA